MTDVHPILTGPFTPMQARQAGVGRRALRSDSYVRVSHGTYLAAAGEVPMERRAQAALSCCPPGSVVSHHTAARLLGMYVPVDQRIHVAVPGNGYRTRRTGIAAHRLFAGHEVIVHRGVACTDVVATVADLSTVLRLPDLVATIDSALASKLLDLEELRDVAGTRRRAGVRLLEQAIGLADGRSESPMESKSRVLIRLAGYPPPECQLMVVGASGRIYYLDMGWERWKVGAEYDGRQHAESPQQYAWDQRRREDIALPGWLLVTAVSDDLYVAPTGLLDRLDAAVAASGGRPPARRIEWKAHFGRH